MLMASEFGEAFTFSPTAVAVTDDGNVLRGVHKTWMPRENSSSWMIQ